MNKIKKFQTFSFNGENYLSSGSKFTVFDLINYFDYSPALLVVEYNKLILVKKDWKQTIILDNDEIEILTIVGGG
jgi:thiamine biosynthesis protein ThiS